MPSISATVSYSLLHLLSGTSRNHEPSSSHHDSHRQDGCLIVSSLAPGFRATALLPQNATRQFACASYDSEAFSRSELEKPGDIRDRSGAAAWARRHLRGKVMRQRPE